MRRDYFAKGVRIAGTVAGMALATYTLGWKTMHPSNREAIKEYLGINEQENGGFNIPYDIPLLEDESNGNRNPRNDAELDMWAGIVDTIERDNRITRETKPVFIFSDN